MIIYFQDLWKIYNTYLYVKNRMQNIYIVQGLFGHKAVLLYSNDMWDQ